LHLTLNFTTSLLRFIFTDRASFRRAVSKKSLISLICFGMVNRSLQHPALITSAVVWKTEAKDAQRFATGDPSNDASKDAKEN
jgi:hypothetical protein